MLDAALARHGPTVYCLREIVHNGQVVDSFRGMGVIFVSALEQVPRGATVVFSAHGVPPAVAGEAARRGLTVVDATCPFVARVHAAVLRRAAQGFTTIMIGHRKHEEVEGVVGESPDTVVVVENAEEARSVGVPDENRVAVVTQTTLSQFETGAIRKILSERFPKIESQPGDDICYATMNRQRAAIELASMCQMVLVLGSTNSSNTLRLAEVAAGADTPARIISRHSELDSIPLQSCMTLGVTAGASTPDSFVDGIVGTLRQRGFDAVEEICVAKESLLFPVPDKLRR
jgi:4-hydroxy-3-methylbut-2-enyl diphosphate reductase